MCQIAETRRPKIVGPIEFVAQLYRLYEDLYVVGSWRDEVRCRLARMQRTASASESRNEASPAPLNGLHPTVTYSFDTV